MKKLSFAFTLLIFSTAIIGSAAEPQAAGPQAYLSKNVYEFTAVVEGTEVVHEFILQNNGDEHLKIIKVESG